MEAPPNRPGHVGYTPQPIGPRLRASREQGVLTSSAVRAFGQLRGYAVQAFPRLQAPEREHTVITMLGVQRTAQTLKDAQPWPFSFRDGYRQGTAPRRGTEDAG